MATALIGLGSNLGDRAATLEKAIELLRGEPQIRVEAVSQQRQSKAAGGPAGQDPFLNAAARIETSLSPEALLSRLLAIEDKIGRIRTERWGTRLIDLDLLLYDRVEMKTSTLELPHPRMCYRRFVLEPAAEIAAEMVWPVNGWSVEKLLSNLDSTLRYVAFACVRDDFTKVFDSILRIMCRVIHESLHADALLEAAGPDPFNPPTNLIEMAVGTQSRRNAEALLSLKTSRDEKWTVSDFWGEFVFDDAESLLKLAGTCEKSEMVSTLRGYRSTVPQPRLLILLVNHDSALATAYECVEQLRRMATAPPSITLSAENPRSVRSEVLAAMQAME